MSPASRDEAGMSRLAEDQARIEDQPDKENAQAGAGQKRSADGLRVNGRFLSKM